MLSFAGVAINICVLLLRGVQTRGKALSTVKQASATVTTHTNQLLDLKTTIAYCTQLMSISAEKCPIPNQHAEVYPEF
jgi:hypothetical protein